MKINNNANKILGRNISMVQAVNKAIPANKRRPGETLPQVIKRLTGKNRTFEEVIDNAIAKAKKEQEAEKRGAKKCGQQYI